MLKNGQVCFKNIAEWTPQILKYVFFFFSNIMKERVKFQELIFFYIHDTLYIVSC